MFFLPYQSGGSKGHIDSKEQICKKKSGFGLVETCHQIEHPTQDSMEQGLSPALNPVTHAFAAMALVAWDILGSVTEGPTVS